MNKSITMKTALAALACTACVSASAQKQYPEQEKMKPGMSEYWTCLLYTSDAADD